MKKISKCADGRQEKPCACAPADAGTVENAGAGRLYEARLLELGLSRTPMVAEVKPARAFQIAHLAATLAKGVDASSGDLLAKATELLNAAGRMVFVGRQAAVMAKGLFIFNAADWEAHGRSLVGLLDDAEGCVPGSPSEQIRIRNEVAQGKAGAAVAQLWKYGPRNGEVLKALFPAKSETEQTRQEKLVELLTFARGCIEGCDQTGWAPDGDRTKACVLHAWQPLGVWGRDGEVVASALKLINELLEKPADARGVELGFYPLVARWLAVMRQEQLVAAKSRA